MCNGATLSEGGREIRRYESEGESMRVSSRLEKEMQTIKNSEDGTKRKVSINGKWKKCA